MTTKPFLLLLALAACHETDAKPVPSRASSELATKEQRLSYGMGVAMARTFDRQHVDVDITALERGLRDGLEGKQLAIPEAELQKSMLGWKGELKQKQLRAIKERSEDAQAAREASAAFLAAHAKEPGVHVLPSGLQYKVLVAGKGAVPTGHDKVRCHYRGTRPNGVEFDSSYRRGQPATFEIASVISGWQQALALMPVGSKWQIVVPPELAFGDKGSGISIPPGSALVFDLELVTIEKG